MRPKINNEIEHLRALSIILVLISHYSFMFPFILEKFPTFIQKASFGVGVDLFFCISGYVVSKAYIDYFDKNNSSYKEEIIENILGRPLNLEITSSSHIDISK